MSRTTIQVLAKTQPVITNEPVTAFRSRLTATRPYVICLLTGLAVVAILAGARLHIVITTLYLKDNQQQRLYNVLLPGREPTRSYTWSSTGPIFAAEEKTYDRYGFRRIAYSFGGMSGFGPPGE